MKKLLTATALLAAALGVSHGAVGALYNCTSGSGTYAGYPYWGSMCRDGTGRQRAEVYTVYGQRLLGQCVAQDQWSYAISWGGQPIAWGRRISC